MAVVKKIGPVEYKISITEGSVRGGYKPFLEESLPIIGDLPTASFMATITIEITNDFAAYARSICSSNLDLAVELGSPSNEVAILHGMMKLPIPIASSRGDGTIPELTTEDISNITTDLESLPLETSVTFTAKVSNNTYMAIIFMPDAKGFNLELIDMTAGLTLYREHPFVLTSSFVIDNLDETKTTGSPGSPISTGSFDDASVFVKTRMETVDFAETLTTELVKARASAQRESLIDAYYLMLNEMFWRSKEIVSDRSTVRPYVDHLYGVGVSGRALQVIPLKGLTGIEGYSRVSLYIKGETDVKYIYGDIRYPANPMLAATKPKFDIISDSEEWTKYGPTTEKYIGGEVIGDEPTTIFSWEGRTSAAPKILPQIAAQLDEF